MAVRRAQFSGIDGSSARSLQHWSFIAIGGSVTDNNGIRTHTFTTIGSQTFQVVSGSNTITVKVWGGGGSSASVGGLHGAGGGGGAGAHFTTLVYSGSYSINVGAGGAPNGAGTSNANGLAGGSSTAFGITCGGGAGGITSASPGTAAGGTVSGSGVSMIASESGQSVNTSISAGTVSGAAGGTNWSGAITAFGGGLGRPQGNGSSITPQPGNPPGGGASSSYGSNFVSQSGARGEIQISYPII